MKLTSKIAFGIAALAAFITVTAPTALTQAAQERVLYATTQDNRLATINTSTSSNRVKAFGGLSENETMIGIDFGPRDGKLYGISNQNRIYTIDPSTAKATAIGSSAFMPSISGTAFGMDFNPTVNRIRVHGNTGFNARFNQETGAMVDFDSATTGTQPDLNLNYTDGGASPSIVGTAYTNSNATATSTVLYAIDSSRDVLVTVAPPNEGKLTVVGKLGVDTSEAVGFDISGSSDGTAYATLTVNGFSRLYTIDLKTGKAKLMRLLGGLTITGIAIAP
jgi:hypothetical protein